MAWLWDDINAIYNQLYRSVIGSPAVKEVEKIIIKEIEMIPPHGNFVRLAGLSGAIAVVMAAYGSHGFSQTEDPRLKMTYEVGNKMHLIHSVALLASPMARKPLLVGSCLSLGMLLFSGSCYYHALTGNQKIRFVTPYGGMLLIFGWLAMII